MADVFLLRILFSLPLLLYASFQDVRHREIDNWVWQAMLALGLITIAMDIQQFNNERLLIPFVFILGTAAVFSLILHYLGLIGGGDAKLIIGLGAVFTFLPPRNFIFPAFYLSVFTNAIIIALLVPLAFFISNLEHLKPINSLRDLPRLFVARKKDAKDVGRFETVLEEGKLFIGTKNVQFGGDKSKGEVWAVPALPFAVFLTAGFLVSISYGDLLHPFI